MAELENKVIITVAPTGSIPTRKDTPYLPITPEEVAEETYRSWQAGASIVHLHARDPETGKPTSDIEVFRRYIELIRERCPIVIQITTGGGATTLGLGAEERLRVVEELCPDSASLNAGSMNFGRKLFTNTPEMMEMFAKRMKELGVKPEFEIYDLGMLENVRRWIIEPGWAQAPYRFSFVLGVMGGAPPESEVLLMMKKMLPENSLWQVIGIGRHQLRLGAVAIAEGGGLRVGFEDNIYLRKGVLAKSNAELVEQAVRMITALGKEVASVEDTRKILNI